MVLGEHQGCRRHAFLGGRYLVGPYKLHTVYPDNYGEGAAGPHICAGASTVIMHPNEGRGGLEACLQVVSGFYEWGCVGGGVGGARGQVPTHAGLNRV